MNPKIIEIMPKKQTPELLYPAYSQALDEVHEALEKNEVCLCPSEDVMAKAIQKAFDERTKYTQDYHSHKLDVKGNRPKFVSIPISVYVAKAIRKLILEGVK